MLKDWLTSAPMLGMLVNTCTFLTDASDVGLGAVISQVQSDREVVIALCVTIIVRVLPVSSTF